MNKLWLYWLTGISVFCIDRITKYMALIWLSNGSYYCCSFLSFELVINRGISWGMFHSSSMVAFVVVSVIIALVTLAVLWHSYFFFKQGLPIVGHVCVIAGSVSNLIDRVYYAGVIDFILFSYNQWSWPVFNAADVAIVCGVGIMMLQNGSHD